MQGALRLGRRARILHLPDQEQAQADIQLGLTSSPSLDPPFRAGSPARTRTTTAAHSRQISIAMVSALILIADGTEEMELYAPLAPSAIVEP